MKKIFVLAFTVYTTAIVTRKLTTMACVKTLASVMTEEERNDMSDRLEARFPKK